MFSLGVVYFANHLAEEEGGGCFCIDVMPITQVTLMGNKNSNIQGRSLIVIKVIFHTIRNCS